MIFDALTYSILAVVLVLTVVVVRLATSDKKSNN